MPNFIREAKSQNQAFKKDPICEQKTYLSFWRWLKIQKAPKMKETLLYLVKKWILWWFVFYFSGVAVIAKSPVDDVFVLIYAISMTILAIFCFLYEDYREEVAEGRRNKNAR